MGFYYPIIIHGILLSYYYPWDFIMGLYNKIPCIKTLKGIPGGMFCENQPMLVHDMLKKKWDFMVL